MQRGYQIRKEGVVESGWKPSKEDKRFVDLTVLLEALKRISQFFSP